MFMDTPPPAARTAPKIEFVRALEIRAYVALIDATLGNRDRVIPLYAAQRLIFELVEAGKAQLSTVHDATRFEMFGLAVVTDAAATGILQNWNNRAKARLAGVE